MLSGGCVVKAVSDSGPIIHLVEVGCFHALQLQIAEVVIPAAIYNEVTRYNMPGSKELKESGIAVLRKKNKLIIMLPDEIAVKLGTKLSTYFNADKTIIIKEK